MYSGSMLDLDQCGPLVQVPVGFPGIAVRAESVTLMEQQPKITWENNTKLHKTASQIIAIIIYIRYIDIKMAIIHPSHQWCVKVSSK